MTLWSRKTPNEVYSGEEIKARLSAQLPRWTLEGGFICRHFKTGGWKATLMVVNTVGHLAEVAWHHPDLTVSFASVTVRLINHEAQGVTEKDFELASKIEEVVQWRPGADSGSALEGTPQDPQHQYVLYD